ncbi:hypothetical protein SAY87_017306 [Trapa incisa]|uniref:Receptor-like protein 12 n=1 Tax=Trapa incisa TaxID=236973 RepID=A0AAN7LA68_9MYRT|nr:hypothetical protein SAY87_017306 [Trapa incisa]
MLSGEIPPEICGTDGNFFSVLDLSKNNFTGELPQCLGQWNWNLDVLALHSNNFRGRIPSFCSSGGSYRTPKMIDLSDNQFEGPLPRSLSNCSSITFLNVGNNKINDSFPSWLGSLPNLGVLILRSNYFHGGIEEPESGSVFPQLQIIDISFNYFQGSLPASYFQYWRYMGEYGHENTNYLSAYMYGPWVVANDYPIYDFSMTIINKGVEMEYRNILGYFKMLDLSSNNFTGNIPGSISSLHGLHLLNISNNLLTGSIPPSLGALTRLEALDLSRNDLSGEIPQQLTELKSISLLNVSYNNLSGPIPKGNQFDTFPNNSYWGNPRLCGDPLSRKCGSSMLLSPPSQKDEGPDAQFEVEWKAIAAGYAVTFVMGIVIGHKMITKHASWFAKTFGLRQLMRRR